MLGYPRNPPPPPLPRGPWRLTGRPTYPPPPSPPPDPQKFSHPVECQELNRPAPLGKAKSQSNTREGKVWSPETDELTKAREEKWREGHISSGDVGVVKAECSTNLPQEGMFFFGKMYALRMQALGTAVIIHMPPLLVLVVALRTFSPVPCPLWSLHHFCCCMLGTGFGNKRPRPDSRYVQDPR